MSNVVHWLLEFKIKPGKLEGFRGVMEDMIASTKNEAGALVYEWCFNEDHTVCNIYERYADSEAVLTHLNAFGAFAERFMDAIEPTKLTVLGNPNEAAKEALSGLSPAFLTLEAGFSR